MNLVRRILSLYSPKYASALIYVAQSSEYRVLPYLTWFWELPNFTKVQQRGRLDKTQVAKFLLLFVSVGVYSQMLMSFGLLIFKSETSSQASSAIFGIVSAPIIWAYLLCLPMLIGRILYINPLEKKQYKQAQAIFKKHKAKKIAVLGSYGKTTMKELLKTVLQDELKVAATPANLNVIRSVAAFARNLEGDEDVIIVEFGEEKPGDIAMFAKMVSPDFAVITGLAPAHLSHYKTISAITDDLLSIAEYVDEDKIFYNDESSMLAAHIGNKFVGYGNTGVKNWKVSAAKFTITGTNFILTSGKKKLKLESGLLGSHQVGPLSAAALLALEMGLNAKQIQSAIKKTSPYEHRMEPRSVNGAQIIDDTYNGNLEGIKVGLELLGTLKAKRKIYITPGLVEQGSESVPVHHEIGSLIARANPDMVVLMQNSVAQHILNGLSEANYPGEVRLEDDPLGFYTNIEHIIAKGDLVLMQNDWPDYYR